MKSYPTNRISFLGVSNRSTSGFFRLLSYGVNAILPDRSPRVIRLIINIDKALLNSTQLDVFQILLELLVQHSP